jgi:TPP-dependent pyruvate/acetoin dehydrogenase alpha subunit
LKRNPEAPLRDALTPVEIKNNPALYKNGNMTVSQAYNNVVKQMNTGAHYATDARNYYRTENNENNTIDNKPIVMASNKGINTPINPASKNNIDGNKPAITKVIESAKPQPNIIPGWNKQDNNALVFAANNPNYRQSMRPQPAQASNITKTNEVNIQAINVSTNGSTPTAVWKDLKTAIEKQPLMQYNEAMS